MSSEFQGAYEIHPIRKVADIGIGSSITSSYFTTQGDGCIDGPTDGRSGNITLVVDSNGSRRRLATAASANDYNHIRGLLQWRREFDPNFFARFALPATVQNRMFIGLTSLTPAEMVASSSLPVGHYCGLWKNESSSNFQFVNNNGSGAAAQSSSILLDTAVHNLYIWLKRANAADLVMFQLDNNARFKTFTSIPGNTVSMQYVAVILTTVNSIRNLDIAKIHLDARI